MSDTFTITTQTLLDIMFADAHQRTKRYGPLYDARLLDAMQNGYTVKLDDIVLLHSKDAFMNLGWFPTYDNDWKNKFITTSADLAIHNIRGIYDLAQSILIALKGRIIVAGGAITRSLLGRHYNPTDLDFFFIQNGETDHQAAIESMLRTIIAIFERDPSGRPFKVFRSTRTVTIMTFEENDDQTTIHRKYQFVTGRMYNSPADVIRGFDIGASQVLYDGHSIFMTPLATFSMLTGILILDPSRRSTTYEARLRKYIKMRSFYIACPFLSKEDVFRKYRSRDPGAFRFETVMNFEPVKGLKAYGGSKSPQTFHICMRNECDSEAEVADYGQEITSEEQIYRANAVMAARGNYHCVTWECTENVSGEPRPQYELHEKYQNPEENLEARDLKLTYKNLKMWLPKEEVAVIWDRELEAFPMSDGNLVETRVEATQKIAERLSAGKKAANKFIQDRPNWEFYGPNQNPGRQHTASFNPLPADLKNYYNPVAKVRQLGISHEVYFLLKKRLALFGLGKDILNLICFHTVRDKLRVFDFIEGFRSRLSQIEDTSTLMVNRPEGRPKFADLKPFDVPCAAQTFVGLRFKLRELYSLSMVDTWHFNAAEVDTKIADVMDEHWPGERESPKKPGPTREQLIEMNKLENRIDALRRIVEVRGQNAISMRNRYQKYFDANENQRMIETSRINAENAEEGHAMLVNKLASLEQRKRDLAERMGIELDEDGNKIEDYEDEDEDEDDSAE